MLSKCSCGDCVPTLIDVIVDLKSREYQDTYQGEYRRHIHKCSWCLCSFRQGDVVIDISRGMRKGKEIHRVCLHEALQDSYDKIPAKGHEIHDVTTEGAIEAYRQHLLERWANETDTDE